MFDNSMNFDRHQTSIFEITSFGRLSVVIVTTLILMWPRLAMGIEGIRAYWPFDGEMFDHSGNGLHGVVVGGAGFVDGKIDKGIAIDSRIGQYVNIGVADIAPPWSVSLWVKKLAHTRSAALLNSPTYSLRLEQYPDTQKIGFTVYGVADHSFNYSVPMNEWAHLVFLGTNSGVSLWANGALQGSVNVPIQCPMATISRLADPLVAVVDDMAVLDRLITASEIVEIYNAGLNGRPFGEDRTAWGPTPQDKEIRVHRMASLRWHAPQDVASPEYNLYFGGNPDQWDLVKTDLTVPTFSPAMAWDQQYFWRVDVVERGEIHAGTLWSFRTGGKAISPTPLDGDGEVTMPDVTLAWDGDQFATSFKLYLDDSLPLNTGPLYEGTLSTFFIEGLSPLTKYYWRVDQYVDDELTIPGDVWSFTTRPKQIGCPRADMDGDCAVTFQDLLLFVPEWIAGSGSVADFVGNDGVGSSDFAVMSEEWETKVESKVVINEIHFDPDVKTELVAFVELHNTGPSDVDLSGWQFCDGITYTFPSGTILPSGGFVVVAEDPSPAHDPITISQKYGTPSRFVLGPFGGNLSKEGEKIELCDASGNEVDQVDYRLGFPWPTVGDPVPTHNGPAGSGHSIQLMNPWLDNDLAGSWRSDYPTPGTENSGIYASNIPPHIRQVEHSPLQPISGQTMTLTAKVTDPDGVASVILQYQIVEPGHYIRYEYSDGNNNRLADPEYETGWIDIPMHDDGMNGDRIAGDQVYTVQIASGIQVHRRLIRYRLRAEDTLGYRVQVPYADDPQPNFAYFVFDGVPPWNGAVQPGVTEPVTFNASTMNSLPVYHLIAKSADIEQCQYEPINQTSPRAQWYQWTGALVFDGIVYDHIWFRNRGWWSTYAWGKNKWKFDFHRGHSFQARDNYGKKYKEQWDKLNFSACIQQVGASDNRGEQGMYEAMTFRLFQLAGVPASNTNWVHFRVIDDEQEATANQYVGDFWGLYLALEQPDGKFLDQRDMPDGNLYKMFFPTSGDSGDRNNQGPSQVTDHSDVETFCRTYRNYPGEPWWYDNAELAEYFSYRVICDTVHHYDLTDRWNCLYYRHPSTNRWWIMPWDVDLSWDHDIFMDDDERWKQVLDYRLFPHVNSGMFRNYGAPTITFRNHARELADLLLNSDQCCPLLDEFAVMINNPGGGPSFVDADRILWDFHPRIQHPGRFYDASPTGDFEGMVQRMKDFISPDGWGGKRLAFIANDPEIPQTPTILYTGPEQWPANGLLFTAGGFGDPQGSGTFAAMKWRIAEVKPWSRITQDTGNLVLIPKGASWRYFEGWKEPSDSFGTWCQIGFDDNPDTTDWQEGRLPIGCGESFIETNLDMQYHYTTVYLRESFEIDNPDTIESLTLAVQYDDGFNAWINNHYFAGENVDSQELVFDATARSSREDHSFVSFISLNPGEFLISGNNVIAIQLLNVSKNSSNDCFLNTSLSAKLKTGNSGSHRSTIYAVNPGRYEMDALWQSDEITDPAQTSIRIPAGVAKPNHSYRVRCRMKDNTGRWSHWSDPAEFVAGEPISAGILDNLRITELMYNPADPPASSVFDNDDFEFIELKNVGDEDLDLSAVAFVDGIQFDFGAGRITTLPANQWMLIVRNQQAFEERYGTGLSARIAGSYFTPENDQKLANEGERITLADQWNGTIAEFEYKDSQGWPLAADGGGHSLVPLVRAIADQPDGSLQYGGNWRASSLIHGSPGADDPTSERTIVINELMAHTDFDNPAHPEYDSNDWIELYNTTPSDIVLSDWYLSDDVKKLKKWRIPDERLGGHAWVSFDEVTGFHAPYPAGFGLNKAGEQIFLSYFPVGSIGRIVDCLEFKGQENRVSLSRYPDGGDFFPAGPTRDLKNTLPHAGIIISEIMYHPLEGNEEYIELYNPTSVTIDLWSGMGLWRLNGDIEFNLPAVISMGVGARLVIVDFDPAVETQRLDNFITTYRTGPLVAGVDIVGPWTGDLSNSTGRITLEKPLAPDPPSTDIPWVTVDVVCFSDQMPWPRKADGMGASLQRITTAVGTSSNDPANWSANTSTPGW